MKWGLDGGYLQGNCPYEASTRQSAIQGEPEEWGFVRWNSKCYSFATKEGMQDFMNDPARFVQATFLAASHSPELLHLFGIDWMIPPSVIVVEDAVYPETADMPAGDSDTPLQEVEEGRPFIRGGVERCEMSVETPTHFVESYIDPTYEFNEWTMRKRAIQLADLRTKRTHSTQTHKSHFRRENTTQTWLPKDKSIQTLKETSANTEKTVRYVAGLRGKPEQKMRVVNMTFDL